MMTGILTFCAVAPLVALMLFMVRRIDNDGSGSYGPLQTHAPQLIGFIMGLVLAVAARLGLSFTNEELSLFSDFLTIAVPIFLSWLAGKLAERYTYSRRTRDREVANASERGRANTV